MNRGATVYIFLLSAVFALVGSTEHVQFDFPDPLHEDMESSKKHTIMQKGTGLFYIKDDPIRKSVEYTLLMEPLEKKHRLMMGGTASDGMFSFETGSSDKPNTLMTISGIGGNEVSVNGLTKTKSLEVSETARAQDLHVNGLTRTIKLEITGADIAERFNFTSRQQDLPIEPGMVVSIDETQPGKMTLSSSAYDRKVAGVISGAQEIGPGLILGSGNQPATDGAQAVALSGRVYCYADATAGPIKPGDLLTTSDRPGHAMKVSDFTRANGTILGKAMTGLDEGTGMVLVLVSLQ